MTANALKWCLILLLLLSGASASGNETDRKTKGSKANKNAGAMYKKGISHFDAGRYKLALEEFKNAYAIKASWKLLYNIGQSAAAGGAYGIALESFEGYLVGGQEQLSLERIDEVREEINRLKIVVGYMEIRTQFSGRIFVDGHYRGKTPLAGVLPVTSGVRSLELRQLDNDEIVFQQEVSVAGEKTVVIAFEQSGDERAEPVTVDTNETMATTPTDETTVTNNSNDTAVTPTDTPPQASPAPRSPSIAPGIILGSVGLIGLGVGTAFVFKNLMEQKDAEQSTDQDYRDTYNEKVRPMNNVGAAVAYGVGVVALTTGVILLVRAQRKKQHARASQPTLSPEVGGFKVRF